MFSWFQPKEAALKPLPLSQREKSYSAACGAVYRYLFVGMRGASHVFDVSLDRDPRFQITIELEADALTAARERMGSALRWNEEYALAKLSLFEAFDESRIETSCVIRVASERVIRYMNELNLA